MCAFVCVRVCTSMWLILNLFVSIHVLQSSQQKTFKVQFWKFPLYTVYQHSNYIDVCAKCFQVCFSGYYVTISNNARQFFQSVVQASVGYSG